MLPIRIRGPTFPSTASPRFFIFDIIRSEFAGPAFSLPPLTLVCQLYFVGFLINDDDDGDQ